MYVYSPEKMVTNPKERALLRACHYGHIEIIKEVLYDNFPQLDINFANDNGARALHIACENGYTDIVKLLLTYPTIDINSKQKSGATPLHLACWKGFFLPLFGAASEEDYTEIVKALLLHSNIDVNLQDVDGKTPLHIACLRYECSDNTKEVVKTLLSNDNINENLQDKWGLHHYIMRARC